VAGGRHVQALELEDDVLADALDVEAGSQAVRPDPSALARP
jgi:hypothetical protein